MTELGAERFGEYLLLVIDLNNESMDCALLVAMTGSRQIFPALLYVRQRTDIL